MTFDGVLPPDFDTLSLKTPILWGYPEKVGTTLPSFLARQSPFFLPYITLLSVLILVQCVRSDSHLDTHRLVNRFPLLRGRRGYHITLATLIIPDNRTLLVSQSILDASR